MKLLGLPGRKSSTFQQMRDLTGRLRLGQTQTTLQAYGFWSAEDVPDPDVRPEARIAAASGADLVIGKSIGTLIAMVARREHEFAPRACVFLATPLRRLEAFGEVPWLESHLAGIPTLLIQQTADYNGSFAEVAALAKRAPLTTALEIPGDDHLYDDIDAIVPLIEAWWASHATTREVRAR